MATLRRRPFALSSDDIRANMGWLSYSSLSLVSKHLVVLRLVRMATRIPKECLSRILLDARQDVVGLKRCYRGEWIGLSHVCRYWRSVALATPDLWSYITLPGDQLVDIDFLKTCLARSKGRLVDIDVSGQDIPDDVQAALMEIITLSAERIRAFRLLTLAMFAAHPLDCRMPNLVKLSFTRRWRVDLPEFEPTVDQFPRLKDLQLRGDMCPWQWHLSTFTSLTHLQFDGCCRQTYTKETFLDILDTCPRLQSLTLKNSLPLGLGLIVEDAPHRVVSLPALHSLTIWDRSVNIAPSIVHIDWPSTCIVKVIICYSSAFEVDEYDEVDLAPTLISHVLRRWEGGGFHSIGCVFLDIAESEVMEGDYEEDSDSERQGGWSLSVGAKQPHSQRSASSHSLTINLVPDVEVPDNGPPDCVACNTLLLHVLSTISSCGPICLHISVSRMEDREFFALGLKWDDVLQRFPQIERLEVQGNCIDLLLDDLGVIPGADPNCPDLKRVVVHFPSTSDRRMIRALKTCVSLREAVGKRFQTVVLVAPRMIRNRRVVTPEEFFSKQYVAWIGSFVDNVHCVHQNSIREIASCVEN
ncbi:hypothetical protein OBBRIDRAFT_825147 [Obba rivulosa]|uniref:F-box domain-containing protein n=1 Tax=Obba rivulosa TaxID=1052685 RepID=A0A8E2AZ11_9APHY|nr:hypothetical protein OBBRIDRAFT_825147 [Obba rivulosa]